MLLLRDFRGGAVLPDLQLKRHAFGDRLDFVEEPTNEHRLSHVSLELSFEFGDQRLELTLCRWRKPRKPSAKSYKAYPQPFLLQEFLTL
jgi:hypothetical protein